MGGFIPPFLYLKIKITLKMNVEKILILGVGNLVMGDEGIGIHVVRELEKQNLPDNVIVIDGGTGGFHLLEYFQTYKTIILIDATMDNKLTGTISVIQPRFSSDFPPSLSAHDIGLKDLLESAQILGSLPKTYLITITIEKIQNMEIELSEDIRKTIPNVIEKINSILDLIDKPSN